MSWKNVMKRREALKKKEEKSDDYETHLLYLILSLYTYQPPIRGEYFDMKIAKTKPADDNKNYLWIDEKK